MIDLDIFLTHVTGQFGGTVIALAVAGVALWKVNRNNERTTKDLKDCHQKHLESTKTIGAMREELGYMKATIDNHKRETDLVSEIRQLVAVFVGNK